MAKTSTPNPPAFAHGACSALLRGRQFPAPRRSDRLRSAGLQACHRWLTVGAVVLVAVTLAGQPPDANRERAYRANNVGVALLEQFDYEAAARSFREALKLHPPFDLARVNLAIALFYAGKPGDAAVEARAAAGRLPDVPQPHYLLGLIARGEDDLAAAAPAFERVLAIDPEDAGARVNLGQIALQQRQYDRALPLFREALAAEPYNVTAAYSIALTLTRSGQAEEGRKAMQRFEALRDSAYGVTYAQTYLAQGKYAEAIASTGAEPELVDPAVPAVTFQDATAAMTKPASGAAGASGGGLTLFDADGDGDLDLFEVNAQGHRLLRNAGGVFSDDTARAGIRLARDGGWAGAVAGDYDNDGRPDLFVPGARANALLRQTSDGAFEDASAAAGIGSPAGELTSAAAADLDHDGDLDLVLAGGSLRLLQNSGKATFTDASAPAGLAGAVGARAIAATDYDNRRDLDLLVLGRARPYLFRNMRDGSFRDVAGEAGLPRDGAYHSALATGDVNKDGYPDFLLGRTGAAGVLALSDGRVRFRTTGAPEETAGAVAAQFFDYDNDGLLDLLALTPQRAHLFRNVGEGRWSDVTRAAALPASDPGRTFEQLALGDLDNDGDTDIAVRLADGAIRLFKNDGGSRKASLRVRLASRVSNRTAVGTKVEMRAGSLRQQLESSSSMPAVAPADLTFGLGARQGADVVRVLWPSGILQAETELTPGTLTVTELDRKPSSCPYLFTWNGTRFEFVSDFMGGSEMGAWVGPRTWNVPDPDEYVRIRPGQLRPRDGRYELRVTNELEEALFVDRLQLVSVDHPEGVDVFPNEGLRSPPRPPLALTATRGARPPARATDEHGHDVLPLLTHVDRRYPDDYAVLPIRGYAAPHHVTLDLGPAAGTGRGEVLGVVLLLTGWTDYAFSNDNVAAFQQGLAMAPPSLQVRDAAGAWRTAISEIGFPVGRPQTIVVHVRGEWLTSSREVRLATNMRVYWDQILVDTSGGAFPTRVTRVDALSADLRWRGFSAEATPDGREPFGYDYARVSASAPWKVLAGRYTREGDVRPLLAAEDDMYVVSRPGDELSVAFDERALPALPSGWTRTLLLYAHGWSKEMNPRSAAPDAVGPLPFRAMSGYPYGPAEHYPRTRLHREYQEKYNTRVVSRDVPSIDASLR